MKFHQKPITFVSQVNLKVQNLERSIAYYEQVIGFKILERSQNSVKLTADGKTALLSIEQPDDVAPKEGRTTGLYHYALLLPTREDLANIVRHFIKIGLPLGSADHLVSEALYLSDPDGNGIEIYSDRDPSEWSWEKGEVNMTTDPLDFKNLLAAGEPSSWEGLPANTIMGHIHLHVSELTKTEQFYTKGLGLEIVNRFGDQALFISDGKYHHHIAINTWNGVGAPSPSPKSAGLESFTMIFSDEEKRNKIIEQLESIGAPIQNNNGSIITADPSGNQILLEV